MRGITMKRLAVAMLVAGLGGCDTFDLPAPSPAPARPEGGTIRRPEPAGHADAEQYSILLHTLRTPGQHVAHAEHYQKVLSERLGWKDVFVVHASGHSEVYWGRYPTIQAAQRNLRRAKDHRAEDGSEPFAQAMVVDMPGRTYGRAEWNLRNVPATYRLLVAVFRDDRASGFVGREKYAVNYGLKLRQHGYPAVCQHGPEVSQVTVGAFGAASVRVERTGRGTKIEIVDPAIKKLQGAFPELLGNGSPVPLLVQDPKTGDTVVQGNVPTRMVCDPTYSYLVAVFKNDPEDNLYGRQRRAAEYCEKLRRAGYQAYYNHAPGVSDVSIGTFGPDDVRIVKGPAGERLEIINPAIRQLQRDFPDLAFNGREFFEVEYDMEKRQRIKVKKKTYLVRVSRETGD